LCIGGGATRPVAAPQAKAAFVGRHPFPGPSLAIRIPGEVTEEAVAILQRADAL